MIFKNMAYNGPKMMENMYHSLYYLLALSFGFLLPQMFFCEKNTIAVFDLHCQQPRPLKLNLEQNNFLRLFTRLSGTSEILAFNPLASIVLDFRPQTVRRNAKC